MPVQKLNRAIMYRAYPTPEQQVLLSKTFGCVRFVWNHMLMDLSLFEAHSSPPKPYGYRWGVLLHNYENTRIDFQ